MRLCTVSPKSPDPSPRGLQLACAQAHKGFSFNVPKCKPSQPSARVPGSRGWTSPPALSRRRARGAESGTRRAVPPGTGRRRPSHQLPPPSHAPSEWISEPHPRGRGLSAGEGGRTPPAPARSSEGTGLRGHRAPRVPGWRDSQCDSQILHPVSPSQAQRSPSPFPWFDARGAAGRAQRSPGPGRSAVLGRRGLLNRRALHLRGPSVPAETKHHVRRRRDHRPRVRQRLRPGESWLRRRRCPQGRVPLHRGPPAPPGPAAPRRVDGVGADAGGWAGVHGVQAAGRC